MAEETLYVVIEYDVFNETGTAIGVFESLDDATAYKEQNIARREISHDYEVNRVPFYRNGDKSWQRPKPAQE